MVVVLYNQISVSIHKAAKALCLFGLYLLAQYSIFKLVSEALSHISMYQMCGQRVIGALLRYRTPQYLTFFVLKLFSRCRQETEGVHSKPHPIHLHHCTSVYQDPLHTSQLTQRLCAREKMVAGIE